MKNKITAICLCAAALTLPILSTASQPAPQASATPAADKPLSETKTITRHATITAIDAKNRLVSLKGEKGAEFDVEVSPDNPNFDKLKVGDVVEATYTESIAVAILPPGEGMTGAEGSVSATTSAGQGQVGRQVTATFKVEGVDAKDNKVTLNNGKHSETIHVVNPKAQERLKTLKKGDTVTIVYNESLAIKLEKVSKK